MPLNDDEIHTVLTGIITEHPDLGVTPRAELLAYIDRTRTAPRVTPGSPIAAGPMRGREMVVVELPKDRYDAMERAYRATLTNR